MAHVQQLKLSRILNTFVFPGRRCNSGWLRLLHISYLNKFNMKILAQFLLLAAVLPGACTLVHSSADSNATVTARERRQLERRVDEMEDALEENRPLDAARVYFDGAFLLAPGASPVTGREAINRYWQGIGGVREWELETLLTTRRLDDVYAHPAYRALKTKPPGWENLGLETGLAVYQLGTSKLEYTGRDGKPATSKVTYILVWNAARDGGWRILVDTYAAS